MFVLLDSLISVGIVFQTIVAKGSPVYYSPRCYLEIEKSPWFHIPACIGITLYKMVYDTMQGFISSLETLSWGIQIASMYYL